MHELELMPGDRIFLFTDGYADQFGGPQGKKFMTKNLKDLLIAHAEQPVEIQSKVMHDHFYSWKGDQEQVDDVLLMGIQID
jgi:serine phosphatase RsbU (regulator of sigma subunit)